MINIQNLFLRFGERVLFNTLSWMIPDGSRIGLVGNNGTGKTTLFRMIISEMKPDSGSVDSSKNQTIGYLPQDLYELEPVPLMLFLKKQCGIYELEEKIKHLEHLLSSPEENPAEHEEHLTKYGNLRETYRIKEGYSFESRAMSIISGLGFKLGDEKKNCSEFSGGWKMRILLSVILLNKPDIMLLDEPTNHLDTESMEWLEGFLKDYAGTLVVISHDRMFLNKMITEIAELFNGKITVYRGNYSYYLAEKDKRLEILEKELEAQKGEIKKTKEFIDRFRYKNTKAKQVQSRIKKLEKIELISIETDNRRIRINFPDCPRSGREVLKVENVSKSYGQLQVFRNVNLNVYRGEKIALVGVNGAGKSTFSRLIGKVEEPTEGNVELGTNVKMSFFSQETSENLNYFRSVWDEVYGISSDLDDKGLRNLLGAFLFSGDDINKKISILSGGEKSRLALLKILLRDSNLLILDEPTNHLDYQTKELFQEALLNYTGTMVIVSHDRFFLDNLADRIVEIRNGKFHEYHGNYSYFIEKRAAMQMTLNESDDLAMRERGNPKKSAKLKRELKSDLRNLEKEITDLEDKKKQNDNELCKAEVIKDVMLTRNLVRENRKLEKILKKKYEEWEDLTLRLEELE
ncbi:MAG: ABC-F family ATP-binding cassette domain-containing protein [bacterium]|nr:ABC-F family ATP-binding cassette domain-containing protein [bacterium]